jgi:hypothetical protein
MFEVRWPEIVAGGVVAMTLEYLVAFVLRWWESRQGEWHGTWYEVLPSYQGLPERWDKVRITQRGNRLTGSAKRITPLDEKKRRWGFEGYVAGDKMIGFFYLKNRKIDPSSYTPVIMARDVHSRHETVWRGTYSRPQFIAEADIFSGRIESGEMWWQRSRPDVRYFGKSLALDSEQVKRTALIEQQTTKQ